MTQANPLPRCHFLGMISCACCPLWLKHFWATQVPGVVARLSGHVTGAIYSRGGPVSERSFLGRRASPRRSSQSLVRRLGAALSGGGSCKLAPRPEWAEQLPTEAPGQMAALRRAKALAGTTRQAWQVRTWCVKIPVLGAARASPFLRQIPSA